MLPRLITMFRAVSFGGAALLTAAALLLSCGGGVPPTRGCTEIGCTNGLTWAFSKPLREPGAYSVRVDLDGVEVTCEATLPFAGCATNSPCSSPTVLLEQSGCALPASEHSLGGLQILSAPRAARVTIHRDGIAVASDAITPAYVRSQPNGAGCPPVCEQARATLTIP